MVSVRNSVFTDARDEVVYKQVIRVVVQSRYERLAFNFFEKKGD